MKQKENKFKSSSTVIAKFAVYLAGIAGLAICFVLLPELVREESVGKPINLFLTYGFFITAYILATPFFIALHQTLQLIHEMERYKTITNKSIKSLRNIKYCAIAFSIMIVVAVITGISIAKSIEPSEDVAPFITIGFIFTFVSSVIAVFVAVFEKILADAKALKSENDLIV